MKVFQVESKPVLHKITNSVITDQEIVDNEIVYDRNGHEWVAEDRAGDNQYYISCLHGDPSYTFEL